MKTIRNKSNKNKRQVWKLIKVLFSNNSYFLFNNFNYFYIINKILDKKVNEL